jgi:5-methylcytosine-specific restriction protein A
LGSLIVSSFMITQIKDAVTGKAPLGSKRSGKWNTVRKHFLEKNPECAACGSKKNLNVHHVEPFHLKPELELEESNLITLCESDCGGVICHLFFGHLGDYKEVNPDVRTDVDIWRKKIKFKPK